MRTLTAFLCLTFAALLFSAGEGFALPPCQGDDETKWQNCEGILTDSMREYVGVFKDGKFEGQNAEHDVKYVGGYKNGTLNGQGTKISADGWKYVGEFRDGNYHGQGTLTLANGNKYGGELRDGLPNGQGTETSADGSVKEGIWKDGELQP